MTAGAGQPSPAQAWVALRDGNARFVAGTPAHPNQGAERRHAIARGQRPIATFFGCADSRVAAEVIFDQGLGDLFVVRTAGHVAGPSELGSLEFGAEVLGVPLVVVLGHDRCGAVGAAVDAFGSGSMPGGFLRDIIEKIAPSVTAAVRAGRHDREDIGAEHVRQTMRVIHERSRILSDRIADGRLAIVGLRYALAQGRATVVDVIGDIGDPDAT